MSVIALDFETSGLNPYHDDIIEIGAKVMGEDKIFECLVKPKSGKRLDHYITELTGICPMLLFREGSLWSNAYSKFYNWLITQLKIGETNVIVSHNGEGFDFIFLKRLLKEMREEMKQDTLALEDYDIIYIDTLLLSKRLLCNVNRHNQPYLCSRFNIPAPNAHRALGDVLSLEKMYEKIIQLLSKYHPIDPQSIWDYIHLDI